MATPYPIATMIGVGKVCQYLAQNAKSKSVLFPNYPFDPILSQKIFVENDSLEYLYNNDPTNVDIDAVANYVWSLLVYTATGYNIYASGNGGNITPITPSTQLPQPLDFVVTAFTTIPSGATSVIIPQFIGYNLDFFRNGVVQNTTNVGDGSSYYTWSRDTGLFTISPAAVATELFRLSPIG